MEEELEKREIQRKRYCSLLVALTHRKVSLTQAGIAQKLGVTPPYISRLKYDDRVNSGVYITIIKKLLESYANCVVYKKNGVAVSVKELLDQYTGFVNDREEGAFEAVRPPEQIPPPLQSGGLTYFRDDIEDLLDQQISKGHKHLRLLDTWIDRSDFFLNLLDRGRLESVEVLVLTPFGKSFVERARGISSEKGQIKRIQHDYLAVLKSILARPFYGEKLKVRLYDEIPGLNCYIIGEVAYFAPYLFNKSSYNNFYIGSTSSVRLRKNESAVNP